MTAKEFSTGWTNTVLYFYDKNTHAPLSEQEAGPYEVTEMTAGHKAVRVFVDASKWIAKQEKKYKQISYNNVFSLYKKHKKIIIVGKGKSPVSGNPINTCSYPTWNAFVRNTGLYEDQVDYYLMEE